MPRCTVQCLFKSNVARTCNQLFCRGDFTVVHSRCWKFLKYVHNLFTRHLWLLSPAGLRLEISGESDKKKMNFIFNYHQKKFLTEKRSACVDVKTEQRVEKFRANQIATVSEARRGQIWELICLAWKLTEWACTRNFPPLRAEGKGSANCRCTQLIPIPTAVF